MSQVLNRLVHSVISRKPHFLFTKWSDLESEISSYYDPAHKCNEDWYSCETNALAEFEVKEALDTALISIFFLIGLEGAGSVKRREAR